MADKSPTPIQSQRSLIGPATQRTFQGSSIPSTCLRRKSPTKKSTPFTGVERRKQSKQSGKKLVKPATDAVNWLKRQGWIDDPTKVDDFVQDVVLGMMNRTGRCPELAIQHRLPAGHGKHVGATVCVTGLAFGGEREDRAETPWKEQREAIAAEEKMISARCGAA